MEKARIEKGEMVYTGFIAQEVEEAADAIGFDFSGIIQPANEKSTYNLSYAEFVVPLVKAVQEQQAVISKQQQEMEDLQIMLNAMQTKLHRLDALESRLAQLELASKRTGSN